MIDVKKGYIQLRTVNKYVALSTKLNLQNFCRESANKFLKKSIYLKFSVIPFICGYVVYIPRGIN